MKRFNYFPGCSANATGKGLGLSVEAVAKSLDLELIELEDWTCCGSTPYNSLNEEESILVGARNLALAEKNGLDIVTPCSSCYTVLNRDNNYLKENPSFRQKVNTALAEVGLNFKGTIRVRLLPEVIYHDITPEVIAQKVKYSLNGLKVASFYGCQMLRPAGFENPENPRSLDEIVEKIGGQPVNFPMKNRCCGSSMVIAESKLAYRQIHKVLKNASDNGAECIITPCPLCHVNLDAYQGAVNSAYGTSFNIPVLYVTQLIGLALGINTSYLGLNTNIVSPAKIVDKILAQGVKSGT